MSAWDRKLARVNGAPGAAPPVPSGTLVEALVHRVEGEAVYVTVPSFDGGRHEFGPIPCGSVEVPAQGAVALVAWPGSGIESPWLVAWR